MEEEFKASVGLATIGSLCVLIATFLPNSNFDKGYFNEEVVIKGFILTGFLMIFLSSIFILGGIIGTNWDREKFIKIVFGFTGLIFFVVSIALLYGFIIGIFW